MGLRRSTGLFSLMLLFLGCQPQPSSTPLGKGSLARLEDELEVRKQARELEARRAKYNTEAVEEPEATGEESEAAGASVVSESPTSGAEEPPHAEPDAKADVSKNASPGADQARDFAGEYHGSDTIVLEFPQTPNQEQTDPHAVLRVEQDGAQLTVIIIDSVDGSDLCSLDATLKGAEARLEADQPCFSAERGGMDAVVERGSATFRNDTIDLKFSGHAELPSFSVAGTMKYEFKGRRSAISSESRKMSDAPLAPVAGLH